VKSRCQIPPCIEHAIDRDRTVADVKCDRHPAAETYDAQARTKVVSARATLGEGFEAEAISKYPIDVCPCAGGS